MSAFVLMVSLIASVVVFLWGMKPKPGDGEIGWSDRVIMALPFAILVLVATIVSARFLAFYSAPKTAGGVVKQIVSFFVLLIVWVKVYGSGVPNSPKHAAIYTIRGRWVLRISGPGRHPRWTGFPLYLDWLSEDVTRQSFDRVARELPATSDQINPTTGEPIIDGTMSAKASLKYAINSRSADEFCQFLENASREGMEDSLEDHLTEAMRLAFAVPHWEKILAGHATTARDIVGLVLLDLVGPFTAEDLRRGMPDVFGLGILIYAFTFSEAKGERGLESAIGLRGAQRLKDEAERAERERFLERTEAIMQRLGLDGKAAVETDLIMSDKVTKEIIEVQGLEKASGGSAIAAGIFGRGGRGPRRGTTRGGRKPVSEMSDEELYELMEQDEEDLS